MSTKTTREPAVSRPSAAMVPDKMLRKDGSVMSDLLRGSAYLGGVLVAGSIVAYETVEHTRNPIAISLISAASTLPMLYGIGKGARHMINVVGNISKSTGEGIKHMGIGIKKLVQASALQAVYIASVVGITFYEPAATTTEKVITWAVAGILTFKPKINSKVWGTKVILGIQSNMGRAIEGYNHFVYGLGKIQK